MRAHRERVTVSLSHVVSVNLPEDFPPGPAEVIVLADVSTARKVVKMAGRLNGLVHFQAGPEDPIADALADLRRERSNRIA